MSQLGREKLAELRIERDVADPFYCSALELAPDVVDRLEPALKPAVVSKAKDQVPFFLKPVVGLIVGGLFGAIVGATREEVQDYVDSECGGDPT